MSELSIWGVTLIPSSRFYQRKSCRVVYW